jgi:hypothetical protein
MSDSRQRLLNTEQAAALLGLRSVVAVRALVNAGHLGCIKIGLKPLYRFSPEHINDYLNSRTVRPVAA